MADEHMLLHVAGRISDGEILDWSSISSTLPSTEAREIADELALVAQIAAGHRQLHQLLPVAPETPANLMPDRARWGHLDLLNVVGRGSYGMVYRAWDTRLERLVALKLFHGARNPDEVIQEGRMLARIRNENVVAVYGADVIDGVAGIWMELVHGKTLENIVKGVGPMDAREAAAVGADVARALAAVHGAGLLHCDVKAQNVVRESKVKSVTDKGDRVVLMDLGSARLVPEARDTDQAVDIAGTPRYMAPELFHKGTTSTRSTDIYSLGVLLYFLVTGKFPIEGKTIGELRTAHESGKITPLGEARRDLPAKLVALVSQALDRDASKRPESAAAMQAQLRAIAAEPPPKPVSRWRGWWAVLAAAGVASGAYVFWPAPSTPAPATPAVRSIAVLPVKNLTGDAAKAYVADGLTELLISNLARFQSLRVPSYTAVGNLPDVEKQPTEVARRLGVQLLLAGSISHANDEIRLAVYLRDTDGRVIWGDEATGPMTGMMAAQGDITRRLAQYLALDLGENGARINSQSQTNPKAQDAYLRGLSLRASSPNAPGDAARAFRDAVDIDPGLADAWAHLSLIETALAERMAAADRERSRLLARQLADRALALDPGNPNAHAALGTIQFYSEWDFAAARDTLKRATEFSGAKAFALQRYAMLLAALGQFDEAIAAAREGADLEPSVALRATSLGTVYYYARDFARAEAEMRRALATTPEFAVAHFGLGRIASARGQHDVAIAEVNRALAQRRNSSWLVELARIYAAAGRGPDKDRILAELETRDAAGDRFSLDNLAYIAAAEGRTDEAFAILDRAVDEKLAAMVWIAVDPRVDALRNDARFSRLLARMNLRK